MTKALKAKIIDLTAKNKNLRRTILAMKSQLDKKQEGVSAQDFVDMRLRAQKAELALEAMTSATTNNQISFSNRQHRFIETVKAAIDNF